MIKLRVLILGYGEMGHAFEYLLTEKHDVSIWSRSSPVTLEQEAKQAQVILFCLPVIAHKEIVNRIAPVLLEGSLCITIAKGLDDSGLTASQVLADSLGGKHRYGVIFGPMISEEIRLGRTAFADVALTDANDFDRVRSLFNESTLICSQVTDMLGSNWSVILKNVYAIMFGVADELKLGANMRGYLSVTALAELSAIVEAFGGDPKTPFTYAGLGDLLTTATSENSHHHELGCKLVKGDFSNIKGEGIHTLEMVRKFQLFDSQAYPLFSLVSNIVKAPAELKNKMANYLVKIRNW